MLCGVSRGAFVAIVAALSQAGFAPGQTPTEPTTTRGTNAPHDSRGRSTAIALNYCKASFHRIRRHPSKRVLIEEQEMILNNLNLNGIADEAVVKLYADVIEEIGQVDIAERERRIMHDAFQRGFTQRVAANLATMGLSAASGQYLGAIRAGAACWWDYRNMGCDRDVDIWRIDRERMTAVTEKSSTFLDTFWKLARDKHIPDRWLIRDDDLDRLEEAIRETDPKVRLRVLERMQPFMECYPPYWYYVARTQQELGQLFAAAKTYDHVADLGHGHFRKDELLCASLANRAAIQQYLGQPGAPDSAREALGYSTSVWEANLMCAEVLAAHDHPQEAEDAILRNLDVGLERERSAASLIELHLRTGNREKLATRLANPEILQSLSISLLLKATATFPPDEVPQEVQRYLATSMAAWPDLRFGPDDFVVQTAPHWHLEGATVSFLLGGRTFVRPRLQSVDGIPQVRFVNVLHWGNPLGTVAELPNVTLAIDYPRMDPIHVHLRQTPRAVHRGAGGKRNPATPSRTYRVVAVDVDQSRIHIIPPDTRSPLPAIAAPPRNSNARTNVEMNKGTNPSALPTAHPQSRTRTPVEVKTSPPASDPPVQLLPPTLDADRP